MQKVREVKHGHAKQNERDRSNTKDTEQGNETSYKIVYDYGTQPLTEISTRNL
jgi:hypothetical protein